MLQEGQMKSICEVQLEICLERDEQACGSEQERELYYQIWRDFYALPSGTSFLQLAEPSPFCREERELAS